jgi:hypothetical protein
VRAERRHLFAAEEALPDAARVGLQLREEGEAVAAQPLRPDREVEGPAEESQLQVDARRRSAVPLSGLHVLLQPIGSEADGLHLLAEVVSREMAGRSRQSARRGGIDGITVDKRAKVFDEQASPATSRA